MTGHVLSKSENKVVVLALLAKELPNFQTSQPWYRSYSKAYPPRISSA
jgi:hypothetical protein